MEMQTFFYYHFIKYSNNSDQYFPCVKILILTLMTARVRKIEIKHFAFSYTKMANMMNNIIKMDNIITRNCYPSFVKDVRSSVLNNNRETNVNEGPDNRWEIAFSKQSSSISPEESLCFSRLITSDFSRICKRTL